MPPKALHKSYRALRDEAERKRLQRKEQNAKYYAKRTDDQKKTYNARQALYMKERRLKEKVDLQAVKKAMEEAESEEMLRNKRAAAALRQRKCRERVSCCVQSI